jgi:hypothetical protein
MRSNDDQTRTCALKSFKYKSQSMYFDPNDFAKETKPFFNLISIENLKKNSNNIDIFFQIFDKINFNILNKPYPTRYFCENFFPLILSDTITQDKVSTIYIAVKDSLNKYEFESNLGLFISEQNPKDQTILEKFFKKTKTEDTNHFDLSKNDYTQNNTESIEYAYKSIENTANKNISTSNFNNSLKEYNTYQTTITELKHTSYEKSLQQKNSTEDTHLFDFSKNDYSQNNTKSIENTANKNISTSNFNDSLKEDNTDQTTITELKRMSYEDLQNFLQQENIDKGKVILTLTRYIQEFNQKNSTDEENEKNALAKQFLYKMRNR